MSGVRLEELSSCDMLDVLHYMFEADMEYPSTAEQAEVRDTIRTSIYREFYDKEYKYASKSSSSGIDNLDPAFGDEDDLPVPVDPAAMAFSKKPYMPPTNLNEDSILPFGNALDAPLR